MELRVGIIKLEVSLPEAAVAIEEFKNNRLRALEKISGEVRWAVSHALNQLMKAEMTLFLGKPDQRDNKRNGYEEREYALKGVGALRIRMPVDRHREFKSEVVPPNERVDPRLKEDMAVLHLAGLSTRTLSMLSSRILGVKVSPQSVTNSLAVIEPQALSWLERPLDGESYWALYVDGTNFRVQRRGSTEKEPSLVVLGITSDNRMSLLAIEPGTKDNVGAWESTFASLVRRGLDAKTIRIGVMDGLPGLEKLFKDTFPNAVTARCWVHALRNSINKCPARLREFFKQGAHKVMYAASENAARVAFAELKRAMGGDAERAVRCLEKDLESLVVHYRFEKKFWRVLKTTNPIERVNKEFKRRTKSMETVGEKTLEKVLAFTALKLEYNWSRWAVDAPHLENFSRYRLRERTTNQIESAIDSLVH